MLEITPLLTGRLLPGCIWWFRSQAGIFHNLILCVRGGKEGWTAQGSGASHHFFVKHGVLPPPPWGWDDHSAVLLPFSPSAHNLGEDEHPASDSQVDIFGPTEDLEETEHVTHVGTSRNNWGGIYKRKIRMPLMYRWGQQASKSDYSQGERIYAQSVMFGVMG